MTPSNSETTKSTFPNGQDSSSPGLLSRLWSWINPYGGLSALRKYNAEMRRLNEENKQIDEWNGKLDEEKRIRYEKSINALRQENARLAELELKLDIVLRSSDTSLNPTTSTDNN